MICIYCADVVLDNKLHKIRGTYIEIDVNNIHVCTVHVGNIKSFIFPTNAHKSILKLLNYAKFLMAIIAPMYFSLHKPSLRSSQSVLCQRYNIDFSIYMPLMEFSVMWLHAQPQHRKLHQRHVYTEINIVPLTKHRLWAPWWWFM